ncbi:MAG: hypothetical protein JWP74_234 [Marmoricola sp.]|nr:hypothetical protein [Marmoricola sp.]
MTASSSPYDDPINPTAPPVREPDDPIVEPTAPGENPEDPA